MEYIYLSPHLDDIALSCGGLVWEQAQAGESVSIWTICAGSPPPGSLSPFAQELHTRWETGPAAFAERRAEDIASCQRLGAIHHHLEIPDCIYRRHPETGEYLYASEASLSSPLHPAEARLVDQLSALLNQSLPSKATLVCPLALGNHVDHQLTRAAAEKLGRYLQYYADYPYVLRYEAHRSELADKGWGYTIYPVSASGLTAWQDAIAAHASQISTFWHSLAAMQQAIQAYCQRNAGLPLWKNEKLTDAQTNPCVS